MLIVYITLASIIVLYFVMAFSPSFLSKKICAICGAVLLTWVGLLTGYFLKWHDNILIIAILMGGSVVGIMYKIEKYFQKKTAGKFLAGTTANYNFRISWRLLDINKTMGYSTYRCRTCRDNWVFNAFFR